MSAYLPFVASVSVAVVGCALILRAGRLEAAGRLTEARLIARRGGFLGAVGSVAAAAGAGTLAPATLFLGSGLAALLAGLSGKPRPTGWAAVALLVAGAVVLLLGLR